MRDEQDARAEAEAEEQPIVDMLSVADLARRFGKTERTIRRWCAVGQLAPIHIGRSVFFRSDDVRKLTATDIARAIINRRTTGPLHSTDVLSGVSASSNDS